MDNADKANSLKAPVTEHQWPQWTAIAASWSAIALGGAVLAGWHAHLTALLQVLPNFAPMQYNTALCFALGGAGHLLLISRRWRLAFAAGGILLLLAVTTLAQYVFDASLGIDQLFVQAYLTAQTSHPGRMSPVTAICFTLTGTALLLQNSRLPDDARTLAAVLCSSLVFALSVAALFGYATGLVWTYAVGSLTRMAVHTAAGFAVISLGSIAWIWHEKKQEGLARAYWLPLPIGVAVAVATLVLWQALVNQNTDQIRQETRLAAKILRSQVDQELETRLQGLVRMAKRWESRHGTPRAEWEADSALYVSQISGYQAIEWVDPTFHVRWIVPLKGNEAAQDLNIAFEPKRKAAAEAARDQGTVVVSHVIDLAQGGKGFLVQVPMFERDRFAGFIVGVFRIRGIFDEMFKGGGIVRYRITIFDGPDEIFSNDIDKKTGNQAYGQEFNLLFHGVIWRFIIEPEPSLVAQDTSALPEVILSSGLMLSVLLIFIVYMTQLAWTREKMIERTNRDLTREIGERKEKESALRESEERLRTITDNVPALVAYVDAQQCYRFNNRVYADWFGVKAEAFYGRPVRQMLGEESYAAIRPQIEAVLAGKPVHFERELNAGGTRRHIDTTYVPHFGDRGEVLGFYGFAYDTTQRHRAEDAVRENEDRLRLITDNLPALISYLDEKQSFQFANRVYRDWLGVEPEKLYGLTLLEFYGQEIYSQIQSKIEAALAGENVTYERESLVAGLRRIFHVHIVPHLGEENIVRGLYVMISDNTDQRMAAESLHESNAFLSSVLDNIPNMVFVKDTKDLKYLRFNKAGEEIVGIAQDQVVGRYDRDLFPEEEATFYTAKDREVIEGEKLVDILEERIHTKHKGVRFLHTKKLPVFDEQGIPRFLLGIAEDITERKMAEEKIRASLEEKEVLLKEIHHRVKNNMQVISSLLQLQQGYIDDGKVKEIFQQSQSRIRAMALVHEKLYQTEDLALIDVGEYVKGLVSMLSRSYAGNASPAAIEVQAERVLLDIDQAIPAGLILNELVSNSIKYAFPSGKTGLINVEIKGSQNNHIVLVVRDNGIGVPPGFDIGGNASLGLRLVKILANQLAGTLEWRNSEGLEVKLTFENKAAAPKE